jgi:hypothetical protein
LIRDSVPLQAAASGRKQPLGGYTHERLLLTQSGPSPKRTKSLAKNSKIEWGRLGIEAAAIVASILLAFIIDAWWEDRLERDLETQQLGRLKVELETNLALIDNWGPTERSVDSGLQVLEAIEEAEAMGKQSIAIASSILWSLTGAQTFDADTSVFDGLIRSGGLEVIRNEQLIASLAAWERETRDYTDLATLARHVTETLLLPALHKRADLSSTLMLSGRAPVTPDDTYSGDTEITLTIDTELKGLIAQKTRALHSAGRSLTDMRKAADAAVESIDRSLSD